MSQQGLSEEDFKFIKQMEYAAREGTHASGADLDRLKDLSWKVSVITETLLREFNTTRLFFVVDSPVDNEEIFETAEEANAYLENKANFEDPAHASMRVCLVKHAYRDEAGAWNYDDYSDTFRTINVEVQN